MIIKEINNKEEWDAFVSQMEHTSFLQSWAWGQFQNRHGNTPMYQGIYDHKQLVGVGMVVQMQSKRGVYLECIGGPLTVNRPAHIEGIKPMFDTWLSHAVQVGHKAGAIFLRLRLPFEDTEQGRMFLRSYGLKEAKLYYQAETTRIVDLLYSERDLLDKMGKQTRYDIRRAERDGVSVTGTNEKGAMDVFLDLYHQTVERQGYVGYSDVYLRSQFEEFAKDGKALVYIATYGNKPVAAAIVFHYGDTVTYHHAASIPVNKISPMSLVLWQIFKDAKAKGYRFVDLFGTAPPDKRYSSREGLTQFKEGFGGYSFQWLRTHDLVLDRIKYTAARVIEMIPGNIRAIGARVMQPR